MIAIPPGVPHFAGSRAAARQRLLAQYQLPEQAKLVATVGPLIAGRFVKELIWAADLLKAVGESFYLLIVGDGPHSWRLARYRDQVRLRDRVRLLGQIADPMDVLAGCDVLWRAGDDGGISQSLLEAAAVGTPVIASDTAAHRRLISAGQTGWLVPDQDRAAFARRTLQVVAEPSVAAAVAADAQRRVRAEFSVETMTEGFQQAYVRAIQAAR